MPTFAGDHVNFSNGSTAHKCQSRALHPPGGCALVRETRHHARMTDEWRSNVLDPVEALISRWQSRGETAATDRLVPVWRSNVGLTDGWHDVLTCIRDVTLSVPLPSEELATLKDVAVAIETSMDQRA
jgi:hypothetical protein